MIMCTHVHISIPTMLYIIMMIYIVIKQKIAVKMLSWKAYIPKLWGKSWWKYEVIGIIV